MATELGSGYVSVGGDTRKLASDIRGFFRKTEKDAGSSGQRSGTAFGSSFSRGMNSDARGQAEGKKFGSGFTRGIAGAIKGVTAGMVLLTRSIGLLAGGFGRMTAALAIASANLTRFSRAALLASIALRSISVVGFAKLAGWFKTLSRLVGILARDIGRAAAMLTVLAAAARGLSVLTRAGRMMGLLTVGLATLVGLASTAAPSLVALAGAIATVGSVAGGMAIAGLSAFGAALAGLKIGVSGVGDAFKAMGQSSGSGGSAAVDNARQVQRAEKSLTKAVEAEQEAQEDVTKAREDARKKLQGLDRQLRGAAQSEKEAKLDLLDAQAELQKGDFENGRERARAVLAVEQAELNLQNVQADNQDLAKEAADARAKGVDGADEVVDAQKKLRDATDATKEAQLDLNEARNPKDSGGGGVDKQAEALAKLSENQRSFVQSVMAVKPAWDSMTKSVQNKLFANLDDEVQPLADTWIPRLGTALGTVTTGFNTGALSIAGWMKSADGIQTTSSWLSTSSQMAANFGVALGKVTPGLMAIAAGAGEAFAPMTRGLGDAATRLSNFLVEAQKTGQIKAFFTDAFNSVKGTIQNIMAVVGPLATAFYELGQRSQAGLAPGLRSVGGAIKEATPGLLQMADKIMPALGQALTNIAPVIPGIVHAFSPWATTLSILVPHLATLIAKLAPMAPYLLGAAMAVKVIAAAYTAFNAVMGFAAVAQGIFAAATGRGTASLAGNTIALGAYRAAQMAGTIATTIASGAVTAFGAALNFAMGPVGLIILGVVAIGAALVLLYKKNETFRNIVQKVWTGIKAAIGAVWGWLQGTVFPIFKTALQAIGTAMTWLWKNVMLPAWNGIKFVISLWWAGVQIYFKIFQVILKAVGAVVMWLWNNIISPAFTGISFVIRLWWAGVQIYFKVFMAVIKGVGSVISWLWRNVAEPAFNGIGSALSSVWSGVIKPVWDGFSAAIKVVGDAAMWLWNNAITPAWNGIKSAITTVWNIVKPIFENIGKGFQVMGQIAAKVGDAMKNAFDGVVDVIKAPLHAIGGLLAKLPGSIMGVDIPGVSTIKSWGETLQNLRSGGFINAAPGGFVVNAAASRKNRGLLSALGGQRIVGPGSGTSDSITAMHNGRPVANVSNGETYFGPGLAGPLAGLLGGINGGMGTGPGLASGGSIPYGLRTGISISYGAPGFPPWVEELGKKFGVQPSTYPGHQESDRNEKGYAPNPQHLNRGIDWSGTVEKMQAFADALYSMAPQFPQLEQIIWQNPNTGKKVGWAGGSPDSTGSYFASDYSGHQDHVHTRQSASFGSTVASKPLQNTNVDGVQPPVWEQGGDTGDLATGGNGTDTETINSEPFSEIKTTRDLFSTWGKITGESLFDIFVPSQFADSIDPVAILDRYTLKDSKKDDKKALEPTSADSAAKAKYKKALKKLNSDLETKKITQAQYNDLKAKLDQEYKDSQKDVTVTSDLDVGKATDQVGNVDPSYIKDGQNTQATGQRGRDGYLKDTVAATKSMKLPLDAAIIAVGTQLVESGIKMYANASVPDSLKFPHDAVGSDHDSVGLYQQRQAGWGTLAERMSAFGSTKLFLSAMVKKFPNWQSMPKGDVAQGVQVSAFPDKYATKMDEARQLLIGKFDRGGLVPPGISLVENRLGRYEQAAVFTPGQWDILQDLPGSGGGTTIDARTIIESMTVADWREAQKELKAIDNRKKLRYSRSHSK
ncbi:tape measure protein [Gordonia phage Dre3]|uniref:Tape measure protein n=1 Tax=Gordonia phage Gibbous TaxID=2652405 RepID=A0A5J6T7E9_9CAUD|nr:tape measure protein [Gordonia phage Gibbous]QFG05092.1 tape measure protein [Gordonia phage Gibbous]QRI45945.1 tape measure protein [Gordonia phage Dre3]